MRIEQLSLFQKPAEIETVEDFVEAAFEVYNYAKDRGWTDYDFLTHTIRLFYGYHGGTAPEAFKGFQFYDYSPKGVELQNFQTGKRIQFKKEAIIRFIKEGGYI